MAGTLHTRQQQQRLNCWLGLAPLGILLLLPLQLYAQEGTVGSQPTVENVDTLLASPDLESAFLNLEHALNRLEQWLSPTAENATAWRSYLKLDLQREKIAHRNAEDLEFWRVILQQLTRNHPGLELTPFVQYRTALKDFLRQTNAAPREGAPQQQHAATELLQNVPREGTTLLEPAQVSRVRAALFHLEQLGQTNPTGTALLQSYRLPNVRLWFSPSLFLQETSPLRSEGPVSGRLNGVPYRGTARTEIVPSVLLIHSDVEAQLGLHLHGRHSARTTSFAEGIRVRSRANYDFMARNRIRFTSAGISAEPFALNGDYSSRITSVIPARGGIRGRIEENQARQRFSESVPAARRKTVNGVRHQLQIELDNRLNHWNASYRSQFLDPLTRLDLGPSVHLGSCNGDHCELAWIVGSALEPAAASVPTNSLPSDCSVGLQIHESAVQNLVRRLSPVQTTTLSSLLRSLRLPGSEPPDRSEELILLPPTSPALECFFRDNQVTFFLHAQQVRYQGQPFEQLTIRCQFALSRDANDRLILKRTEEPSVTRSVLAASPRRSGVRDIVMRRVLTKVLSREIPSQIDLAQLLNAPLNSKYSTANVESISSENGWLHLIWR